MLKVMIVEDEQPTLDLMNLLISQQPQLTVAGSYTSPIEALEMFAVIRPDVVFLDVEMPEMNGIQLAEKIVQIDQDIQIVFTTAYEQYAVQAFKVYAVDYLVKFVTSDDINRVTSRLLKNHLDKTKLAQINLTTKTLIQCLGKFEVRGEDGTVVKWPTRKTEELFAYFLIHPNQVINKWKLMDMFWTKNATVNLHTTISRLKKVLKENNMKLQIRNLNDGYILDVETEYCDLLTFKAYFAHNDKVNKDNLKISERTFQVYKGHLFEMKDYLWVLGVEEELTVMYEKLTRELANYFIKEGDINRSEEVVKTFLTLYPLHEEMTIFLLNIYASHHIYEKRLKEYYKNYVKLLRDELGVEPSNEVKQFIPN
ncbi:response regulator [Cytobacillus sp. Hm23]